MKTPKSVFLLRSIRGAIGKEYVIKHYGRKMLITKYPDMSDIIPSKKQHIQRSLFKEAVAYAKKVISDPVKKAAWQKKIRRRNGVYNEAIRKYMLIAKAKKEQLPMVAVYRINQSFKNIPIAEMKQTVLSATDIQLPSLYTKRRSRIVVTAS